MPYEGLWKNTYIDEHALSPGQVTMYYSWSDVHAADRYLADLERLESSSQEERSSYIKNTFLDAGVDSDNTSTATWGHVRPPRSSGTETILLSASWVSREGGPNLRGIAALLSIGAFLRGELLWLLIVGLSAHTAHRSKPLGVRLCPGRERGLYRGIGGVHARIPQALPRIDLDSYESGLSRSFL